MKQKSYLQYEFSTADL